MYDLTCQRNGDPRTAEKMEEGDTDVEALAATNLSRKQNEQRENTSKEGKAR